MPKIEGIHKSAASGGELNFYTKGSADVTTVCDFVVGNCATFDGCPCALTPCASFTIVTCAACLINCSFDFFVF